MEIYTIEEIFVLLDSLGAAVYLICFYTIERRVQWSSLETTTDIENKLSYSQILDEIL